jgi:hypothetical protein
MDPSDLASLNGVLLGDLDNPMKMSDAGTSIIIRVTYAYRYGTLPEFFLEAHFAFIRLRGT